MHAGGQHRSSFRQLHAKPNGKQEHDFQESAEKGREARGGSSDVTR